MADLAAQDPERLVPLKEIAAREGLSQKYLEAIMTTLSKGGLVGGQHGKGGGYRLLRRPEEYSLGEILRLTEGRLAPVACLEEGAAPCAHPCPSLPVWEKLEQLVAEYLDSVTLADLLPK
jgi:Rrf2 family protein